MMVPPEALTPLLVVALFMGVLLVLGVIIVAAYVITRAASVAHYRTKLEYLRSVFREGGDNGR